jgi:crotonobetainyl-CoA:carnitine CoA-transferase CaiB-like acyl-CoA transferase
MCIQRSESRLWAWAKALLVCLLALDCGRRCCAQGVGFCFAAGTRCANFPLRSSSAWTASGQAHASAYLNNGVEPTRRQYGAHSYYVPAQLFPTADGYLALFITHDGFWKSFAAEAGIHGFEQMAERVARRDEVLAVVTAALGTDTAASWEARLRPLGVPAAAVRTLPEALQATPEIVVNAGDYRLVGNPIRVDGYQPDYRPPPTLG